MSEPTYPKGKPLFSPQEEDILRRNAAEYLEMLRRQKEIRPGAIGGIGGAVQTAPDTLKKLREGSVEEELRNLENAVSNIEAILAELEKSMNAVLVPITPEPPCNPAEQPCPPCDLSARIRAVWSRAVSLQYSLKSLLNRNMLQ